MVRKNILDAMVPAQQIQQKEEFTYARVLDTTINGQVNSYVIHKIFNYMLFVDNIRVYALDMDSWRLSVVSPDFTFQPLAIAISPLGNYVLVVGSAGNAVYAEFTPGAAPTWVPIVGLPAVSFYTADFRVPPLRNTVLQSALVGGAGGNLATIDLPTGAVNLYPLTATDVVYGVANKHFEDYFIVLCGRRLFRHDWATHLNTQVNQTPGTFPFRQLEWIESTPMFMLSYKIVTGTDAVTRGEGLLAIYNVDTQQVQQVNLTAQDQVFGANTQRASRKSTWRPIYERDIIVDYEITAPSINGRTGPGVIIPVQRMFIDRYRINTERLSNLTSGEYPNVPILDGVVWDKLYQSQIAFNPYTPGAGLTSREAITLLEYERILKVTTDPTRPLIIGANPQNMQQPLFNQSFSQMPAGVPVTSPAIQIRGFSVKLFFFANTFNQSVTITSIQGGVEPSFVVYKELLAAPVVIPSLGGVNVQTLTDAWPYVRVVAQTTVSPTLGQFIGIIDMRV